ncbi:phage tail tube protein [Acinetobacter gerneri]|jgi:hypothetical protein|uniref:phage tail tube protein n=1 Tax=Acinetobacter gerneri TaxID=202952 RepID=UPI0023F39622|nr:phage tail tube protein [Acinetobacter gerneri]MCH4245936.1 phage tail tube protein [Acinetobacter gerneri]
MSSGAKQITRYAVETTPGVLATTGWKTLANTSNSMDAKAKTAESQTIKDSRIASGTLVTGADFAGDIDTEFAYGIQEDWLEIVAMNLWKNNVLTFGGTVRKSLTIERSFSDVENFQVFTGCHLNQWVLTIPEDGIVTSKYSLMGMGRKAYETSQAKTPASAIEATQFTNQNVGNVLIDGQKKAGMCATQLDLTIDNTMQIQNCLDFEQNISAILETVMKSSGNVTLAWSKNTADLYEKQFLNEPISLSYTLKDGQGNQYVLLLPRILLSAPLPTGGAGDILNTQFTFTVDGEAPTLTRVPVVVGP